MYNDWINEILVTKELPDYEFSPFPKPNGIVFEEDGGNSARVAVAPNIVIIVAVFSVILRIAL